MAKHFSTVRKIIAGDAIARFNLLKYFARFLCPSYRFKWPQMDWWNDAAFTCYLEKFGEATGLNTDRHWMVGQLLRFSQSIAGDTAECGVYRGATSYLICEYNAKHSPGVKTHFMFDSFLGLSEPHANDGEYWSKGDLAVSLEEVKETFHKYKDIEFMQGWIPSRFQEVSSRIFSFVHIDVDLYQPTLESIEFFYPRMSPGGVIICDDYGFTTCPGATQAINDFLEDKPEKMISLCCGGGFIIKGIVTD